MTILSLQHIQKSFGGNHLLSNVSLDITSGKIIGLVGSNGSGKTTLFNLISGLEKCDSGEIIFDGHNLSTFSARQRSALGIARMFQNPRVFHNQSLEDNLLVAIQSNIGENVWKYFTQYQKIKEKESQYRMEAQNVLEQVGLKQKQHNKAGELSYGQQKLLSFGMLLMNKPKLILLDEFFAGVSVSMIAETTQILRNLTKQGISILMVEHNVEALTQVCNEVFRLQNGHLTISEPLLHG